MTVAGSVAAQSVAMEVFQQLTWAVTEPVALFETELAMFVARLRADHREPTDRPAGATGRPVRAAGLTDPAGAH